MVKPVVAGAVIVGSLISGAVMYTVGASQRVDALETTDFVQTVDGGFVPVSRVTYPDAVRPAAEPIRLVTPRATPTSTVYRTASPEPVYRTVSPAPVQEREVIRETVVREQTVAAAEEEIAPSEERSWKKTAMIIGGSAASGAGVGGIVKGKKGALIGAAIGGGAASIYEATRRR
jgi:hypothetical protein